MASILRIPCVWSGGTGLPGVSVFYSNAPDVSAIADLLAFFDDIKVYIPAGVSINVPSSGDSISDTNGALDGSWSGGAGGTVTGTGTPDWAAGVGVAVQWNTGGIRNGRRVRGRTFLAPLTVAAFADNGTMDTATLAVLQTAATLLVSGGDLCIWSRPSEPGGSDGESNTILSAAVPDRITALRSRRY